MKNNDKKFIRRIAPLSAIIASLCCLTPVVLVLLGISSVSFALSLNNVLYGQYEWAFKLAGILSLTGALFWYFYKKEGICTLDQVKRNRTRIINLTLITVIATFVIYILIFHLMIPLLEKYVGLI